MAKPRFNSQVFTVVADAINRTRNRCEKPEELAGVHATAEQIAGEFERAGTFNRELFMENCGFPLV